MSKRDTTAGLKDIREGIERIQRYVGTLGLDDFLTNTEKQDAVVRNFEIIGRPRKPVGRIQKKTQARRVERDGWIQGQADPPLLRHESENPVGRGSEQAPLLVGRTHMAGSTAILDCRCHRLRSRILLAISASVLISMGPHKPPSQTGERRTADSARCKLTLAPLAVETQKRWADDSKRL